ncbi:MAG: hypothetical protein HZC55_22200 [Verrucomicrobia bacterium]|nr:hypothetical protein [Verrucomicrobiota bacterium]
MSVLKTLQQRLAPELNFLFTIPPVETPVGWDCGWRPHEHAWHTYFVARMFGSRASLCTGDYALLSRLMPPLTTLEREPKHAWCTIGELTPVDLSMTFAHFANVPQLRTAITGEGVNGDWIVRYSEDEAILDENVESGNEILFIQRQVIADTAEALLEDPGRFLPPPPPAASDNWVAHHGPDIHLKIALHCYRYAAGNGRSIRNKASREEAMTWIASTYADPKPAILKLLVA